MEITKKERDCIVKIKELSGSFPPRLSDLAVGLNIKPPTAIELLERLERKGLIKKEHGMIILTDNGNNEYSKIMLAHRTYETLLSMSGVSAEDACLQAEKIDYLMEPESMRHVLKSLGSPEKCPHGKPIPKE
ncbi:metal-dependent transcriptional regulator [Picrophilus oshimae]|uniref:Iron-dependent repressor n=1 Tax=Picrophilus torridus (strain ATCC 700027 / DSM 9790 / JCM 10055 / NBRC 100828 / KAW 2/3) TaxID=1122961 RepID=Q6L0D8_PICTO|nr:metal-dependent transcriptional regulator [Picrophilus oshimae]AAT43564.1 iron-dependent repressor [Picrophilus oshimae DSM 9789]